jgi:mRNA interferase RelE/StbE
MAVARVRAAATKAPHLLGLADVMERLGKLAAGIEVASDPPQQPVPDWLAQRLIYTVGLPREVVAAMDLQRAVDKWGEYTSGIQP